MNDIFRTDAYPETIECEFSPLCLDFRGRGGHPSRRCRRSRAGHLRTDLPERPLPGVEWICRGSDLLWSRQFETYVLGVEKLPYVWVYDESGKIETVLKIAEYRPQTLEYDTKDRSRCWSGERYSETHQLSVVDDRFMLLAVPQSDENRTHVDYYILDLKTDTPFFQGTDSLEEKVVERLVLVHDLHSVLIEHGAMALIESM